MKNILVTGLMLLSAVGFAQDNLVENGHFKQTESKKIKGLGQVEYAAPWTSPTLAKADLYVPKTKAYDISIPENSYGEEKPMEKEGYAGIIAYSYKNKVPRSYLQSKLTQKLEAGKEYCVRFHVSLADLSKYAVNHIAMALSEKEVTANNSDVLSFDNTIVSKRLTVYEQQFYWTPICGIYKAKGGEEFITIGNFTPDAKLTLKKVKRPRGFTKPQKYDAYYYIDNVSVTPKDKAGKCDCDVVPGMENAETVERDFSSDKSIQAKNVKIINTDGSTAGTKTNAAKANSGELTEESINGLVVAFDPKGFALSAEGTAKLDKVAEYLKANADDKINITGYVDASEADVAKLDGRRVGTVYKYLVSKGVAKDRIERAMGGEDPVDEKQKLKNMRVEISIVIPLE
jgi:outer membrane protein OmpA-like peptidoglycan-associated protein